MIARALPKNSSETQEKSYFQDPKSYLDFLDTGLIIIEIGIEANQNFSFYPRVKKDLTKPNSCIKI